MHTELVLKSRRHGALTPEERAKLERSIETVRVVEPRATLVREGELVNFSTLLLEGVMSRYVDDRKGLRQLVAVHFAGDFVDLHAYPLKVLDHSVGTLTRSRVALIPHSALAEIQAQDPELARKLWFLTLIDAAMHRKWVFRLGRLKAAARMAHFLCETNVRLFAIGLSDGRQFELPLTQVDLGEVCGLTSIHVNRVVRILRERGLATVVKGRVMIDNWPALVKLAEFEPSYLYFDEDIGSRIDAAWNRK